MPCREPGGGAGRSRAFPLRLSKVKHSDADIDHLAAALGAALVLSWPMALAVFLMLGLGLALPYLAISLSPGLLSRLPRPGVWMERLKGLLAFPMYGAALWLLWVFTRQGGVDALGLEAVVVLGVNDAVLAFLTANIPDIGFESYLTQNETELEAESAPLAVYSTEDESGASMSLYE